MDKDIILTGVRSNDEITLGNYLGAILPVVEIATKKAGEFQVNMFVPDLHSFTTEIDHSNLLSSTMTNLKTFVAAGIPLDHEDIYLYRQSYIPQHSELAWILGCFTGYGELSRMVEFKSKSDRIGEKRISLGLFSYPVLMAADILLYGAKYIPVGEDQRQHLELTRTLAERMNKKFGKLFEIPLDLKKQQEFISRDSAPRIRSLKNPEVKMSKSIEDPSGTILISDSPRAAANKVMAATTDSKGKIDYDFKEQPGISNLLQILALLENKSIKEIRTSWYGKDNYGDLKSAVASSVEKLLTTVQTNIKSVNENELKMKLEESESKLRLIAQKTLINVQSAVGLRVK